MAYLLSHNLFSVIGYSNEKVLLYNGMYSVVLSAQTQFLSILVFACRLQTGDMSILLLAALFTISFFYLHFRNAKRPPGPGWIPLLGSLPFLTLKNGILDWVLDENITKYKIATVYILQSRLFVINDFDLAKVKQSSSLVIKYFIYQTRFNIRICKFQDLFGRDEFSGKKVSNFLRENRFFKNEPQGIVNTEGSHWMIQRRFSLKTLKDFGFGRQSLEGAINTEIDIVIEEFLSREV